MDEAGNLYVADTRNHRIQKLSLSGEPLGQWGTEGRGPGQFQAPAGLAVDGAGNLYVADAGVARVQKLAPTGEPLAEWSTRSTSPPLVAFCVSLAPSNAEWVGRCAASDPEWVALDADGTLYVADTYHLLKLSPSGQHLDVLGQSTPARPLQPGYFQAHPGGMAFDPRGNLYVADSGARRILRFTPRWASQWESTN